MKKLLLLFVSVYLCTSCSNNDEINLPDISESEITGQWELIDLTSSAKSSGLIRGQSVDLELSSYGKNYDFTYDFTNNPNRVTATGSYTLLSTIKILGQEETNETTVTPIDLGSEGEWSLTNNSLTIVWDNSSPEVIVLTDEVQIIEFDGTTMKLKVNLDEDSADKEIQGVKIKVKVNFTTNFTLKRK